MKKGIVVNLDKPRLLRYGMNALALIEDLTGRPISQMDMNNIGIRDLRIIIYAGLSHEDKGITIEQVGDIIDEYSSMSDIAEKVGEAFTLAFGEAEKENNPKA